jgi:hypothetical protein
VRRSFYTKCLIESNKVTLVISSDDWNAWLASLNPTLASVTVQVEDPRDPGKVLHTIADIRWPTSWARD